MLCPIRHFSGISLILSTIRQEIRIILFTDGNCGTDELNNLPKIGYGETRFKFKVSDPQGPALNDYLGF